MTRVRGREFFGREVGAHHGCGQAERRMISERIKAALQAAKAGSECSQREPKNQSSTQDLTNRHNFPENAPGDRVRNRAPCARIRTIGTWDSSTFLQFLHCLQGVERGRADRMSSIPSLIPSLPTAAMRRPLAEGSLE
jgi:hypothetical protein